MLLFKSSFKLFESKFSSDWENPIELVSVWALYYEYAIGSFISKNKFIIL